jgi:DNA-directed RNA polymerase specialized sigma24 family protein
VAEETFQALIEDFSQVKSGTSPAVLLMALAWKSWNKVKSQKFHEWKLPILQSMKSLGVEQRAALFAIDIAGLEIDEAAKIFGTTDTLVRQMLAQAHKHLAVAAINV